MSDLTIKIEEAREQAAKADMEVIEGTPCTLLLDIDSPEAHEQFKKVFPVFADKFGVANTEHWNSQNGNLHIVVTLCEDYPALYRLAFQAALGSDGKREILGIKRLTLGVEEPSLLFKPKKSASPRWLR